MYNTLKDKVLQSTDIVEVIQEHVSLRRQGKEFVGLCPFHPDHKPSLQVSPKKQIFKCFACGAGGDAIKFVQLKERTGFSEALEMLARRAGLTVGDSEADRQADRRRDELRQALIWARAHFQRNLRETRGGAKALEYARSRGLSQETIERFGLGYAADAWDDLLRAATRAGIPGDVLHQAGLITTNEQNKTYDRFRHRLIFPISDGLGRIVAFGGRTLGDDSAKYLNSPETGLFSKSRTLFALDLARHAIEKHRAAVIVEGYMDAVLLHQHGFTHTVATLGTALTDAHVKSLKTRAERLILCFDGDQAGVKAADRAVEVAVLGGIDVGVVVLDAGTDPADCVVHGGAAAFERAMQSAVDALEFKWRLTAAPAGAPDGRSPRARIEALIEFMAGVLAQGRRDPLGQGLLVRRLSELLGLPAEAVYQMLWAAQKRRHHAPALETATAEIESGYAESARGLAGGLVAAVEELLGLLLIDWRCIGQVTDQFVDVIASVPPWNRLYAAMHKLLDESGQYTQREVQERCDDAELCELVGVALARVHGTTDPLAAFAAANQRLASEVELRRRSELQQALKAADPDAALAALAALRKSASAQHCVLSAEAYGYGAGTE